jgi:hypothetical protein
VTSHTPRTTHDQHPEKSKQEQPAQLANEPASDFNGESADLQSLPPNQLLRLQRTVGNQAVVSLLGQTPSLPHPHRQTSSIQRKLGDGLAQYSRIKYQSTGKSGEEPIPKSITETAAVLLEELGKLYTLPTGMKLGILKSKLEKLIKSDYPYSSLTEIAVSVGLASEAPMTKDDTTTTETSESGEEPGGMSGGTTWTPNEDGLARTRVTAVKGEPPQEFGQLALKYEFNTKGLKFTADVFSNPKLIWEHGDKVSISLQFKNGASYLIGDLRVQKEGNIIKLDVEISYSSLAGIMGIPVPQGNVEKKRAALALGSAQMGVLAMWRTVDDKGEQHRSGGIDQKGGSGLINVSATPITEETLKKTEDEGIRNVGWNENEKNNPDRPVYKSFPNLIKLEEEIATTLEAESEYMVSKDGYQKILLAMSSISGKDKEELLKSFGITKEVKASEKVYIDTYYDLATDDESDTSLPLLENNIVFRRRSVPKELNKGEGDVEGTNLIAIKGRSVTNDGEAIRLASQFQAQYDLLDPSKQEEVMSFLKSEMVDNPFARTLQDALEKAKQGEVLEQATHLKKALTVISKRTKYKLWLENSTMIDLSVDEARGQMDSVEPSDDHVVYSFEFGVGHPGLSTGATGSGGLAEEDPKLKKLVEERDKAKKEGNLGSQTIKSDQIKARQSKTSQLVHRPYHVPKDLENESLFKKDDYTQYKNLRDAIIAKLFEMDKTSLDRGGNKAKLLAQKMGLLPTPGK